VILWIGSAPNPFLLTVIPVFPSVTVVMKISPFPILYGPAA